MEARLKISAFLKKADFLQLKRSILSHLTLSICGFKAPPASIRSPDCHQFCELSFIIFVELHNFVSWERNQLRGKLLGTVWTWWHARKRSRSSPCITVLRRDRFERLWATCVFKRFVNVCSFVLVSLKRRETEWEVSGGWNMYELLRQICIKPDWSARKSWEEEKKREFWKEVKEKVDGDKKDKHEEKTEQLLNANSVERERMCWLSVPQCKQPAGNGNSLSFFYFVLF